MSYMTMTMFAPRIWGFDLSSPEARIARQAGWRRSDILWEKLMEAANLAFTEGDTNRAAALFRRARWMAWLGFGRNDPRRITVLVNQSLLAQLTGRANTARKGLRHARMIWPDWQYPHWGTCSLIQAAWILLIVPSTPPTPSMVVTSAPSAGATKTVQDLTDLPFTVTVQAPQWDVSQPICGPVMFSRSRRV